MIFDAIFVLLCIIFILSSKTKSTLHSLNFFLAAFTGVKVAELLYQFVAKIISSFIDIRLLYIETLCFFILIIAGVMFYFYIAGDRIEAFSKRLSSRFWQVLAYLFSLLKGVAVFTAIYFILTVFPFVDRLPSNLKNTRFDNIKSIIAGSGTEMLFDKIGNSMDNMRSPMGYFRSQQNKQLEGSKKELENIKEHGY